MSNPTRQEIIEAHEALEALSKRSLGTRYVEMAILKALPPRPQPTMADMGWDDDKHYLAEAEFDGYGPSIMLWETTSNCISVISGGLVRPAFPEELTPTGKRYTLTEVETHAS